MQVKKLTIKNFRGIKDQEFELDEKLNVFKGANSVGKTTLIDSVLWVLCGETLVYGKQDSDNRNKHNLKEVVNVLLELDNGIVLERKYFDNWKEDNDGNLRYVRTENKFFIDGASYGKEEYFERIRNDLGLEYNLKTKDFNILRFLMDYNYFGTIDYKISRKFLEEILGLKKDEELVREEKYRLIATDMINQKFEIGKVVSKYRNAIKNLESDIESTESKIKDRKSLINNKELEQYEELIAKRNSLLNENINENSDIKAIEQQIQELGIKIQDKEKSIVNEIIEKNNEIQLLNIEGNDIKSKVYANENSINIYNNKINTNKFIIEQENIKINDLETKEFKEQKCFNCGAVLNQEEKENYEENRNETIALYKAKVVKLEEENKQLQDSIDDVKSLNDKLNKDFAKNEKRYNELLSELDNLNKQRDNNLEVKELQNKVEELTKDKTDLFNRLTLERNNLLYEVSDKLDYFNTMLNAEKEIENLQQAIKNFKIEKSNYEMKIEIVKDFKQMKLDTINKKTQNVFPHLDIQIIEINENTDVIKEVCYAKFKDVEFKGMNDGYRYLLGIQIIEDIKKHMNLQDLPLVFDKFSDIDNETLSKIQSITNSQIITTKVEEYKEITLNGK